MRHLQTLSYFLIFFVSISSAQELRYNIKKDNPMGAKNLILHIDPWFTDIQVSGPATGAAFRADWLTSKIMDVSFEWRVPYFDLNSYELSQVDLNRQNFMPAEDDFKYQYLETVLRWHLSDKVKMKNHAFVVSQSTYATKNAEDVTKTIELEAKSRRITSFESGAYYLHAPVLFQGSMLFPRLTDHSGFDFSPLSDQQPTTTSPIGGSMLQTICLVGGFSFQRINNLKILTNLYGVKYSTGWSNFYLQGFYAPIQRFGNVIDSSSKEWSITNKNMIPWGFRMGYTYKNTKSADWSMKLNTGVRPGLGILAGAFFDLNFGVSIPTHLRFKSKGKQVEAIKESLP